jgi:hypothetical protein
MGMNQSTFDPERLDVYRLSVEYVAFSYRIAKDLTGVQRPALDQWLIEVETRWLF